MTTRTIIPALFLAACPVSATAQESIPAELQQAFERYTKLPDTLLPVLEGITDQKTADAAAPKLHDLLPEVYDTRSAMQGIKELSPQMSEVIRQRYERAMREKWGIFYEEAFRLQKANCFGSAAFAKEFNLMCMMLQ